MILYYIFFAGNIKYLYIQRKIMNKKKKIIIIVAAVLLLAAAIAAAVYFIGREKAQQGPTLEETVESRVAAYKTDLRDSFPSMTDQRAVAEYLDNWAKNKGIESEIDKHGNVIYAVPASEGYEDKTPIVFVSEYDYSCMENYENSIVSALTIAKNDEAHGQYRVVFISREGGSLDAAEGLSGRYFSENCQVVYLGGATASRIATATGGYEEFHLTKDLSYAYPEYDHAFRITVSGLPAQSFSSVSVSDPNAISILGDVLAYFKSHSTLFEIASFNGGQDADMVPSEASVTVVVNDSTLTRFENRIVKEQEDFYEDYGDKFKDAQFTCEAVEMPGRVLGAEDTESIISLMYTAPCGIHYKDDNGDVVSIANVGRISTEGGSFVLECCASSWDVAQLAELDEIYQTTAGLSNVSCQLVSSYEPFVIDESNQPFEVAFREAYADYHNTDLDSVNMPEITPCATLYDKAAGIEILAAGVTERTADNFAGAAIIYLRTLEPSI